MAKAKQEQSEAKPTNFFANFRQFGKPSELKKFTDQLKGRFLELYAETGRLNWAAESVGVSGQTVRVHLKDDLEFAAAFETARNHYGEKIQKEIQRRGIEGVREPIINFRDNTIAGHVLKFSDRLLEMNAKRFIPEYRDKLEIDANVQTGVLVVTSTESMTPEEWALKFAKKGSKEA